MSISQIIFISVPIILFLVYIIGGKQDGGLKVSPAVFYIIACIYIFSMGLSPADEGDKGAYYKSFITSTLLRIDYKDSGWIYYMYYFRTLLGETPWFFFIITATIYVLSYISLTMKFISPNYRFPFIVLVVGSLGFTSYGINTIRSGFALAFFFFGLCNQSSKKINYQQIVLFMISIAMHKSMLLLIGSYYLSSYIKKTKKFELLWFFFLALSIANFNLSDLFESWGLLNVDMRVEGYLEASDSVMEAYEKAGFRIDFIAYSIVPILFTRFIITNFHISDIFFLKIYKIYLICNSVWLLVIRVPYTDRFAYLSWCLIPLLIVYPFSKRYCFYKDAKFMLTTLILMFICIPIYLAFR